MYWAPTSSEETRRPSPNKSPRVLVLPALFRFRERRTRCGAAATTDCPVVRLPFEQYGVHEGRASSTGGPALKFREPHRPAGGAESSGVRSPQEEGQEKGSGNPQELRSNVCVTQCPYEFCQKAYGSEVSLNLHIKLKHSSQLLAGPLGKRGGDSQCEDGQEGPNESAQSQSGLNSNAGHEGSK